MGNEIPTLEEAANRLCETLLKSLSPPEPAGTNIRTAFTVFAASCRKVDRDLQALRVGVQRVSDNDNG